MKTKSGYLVFCSIFLIGFVLAVFGAGNYFYGRYRLDFGEKASKNDVVGAWIVFEKWENSLVFKFSGFLPSVKEDAVLKKAWLLAQSGLYVEAAKEYRKLGGKNSDALFNAATVALAGGQESPERIIQEYTDALILDSRHFKSKINLEILFSEQQKNKKNSDNGEKDGEGKPDKIKKYRPGDSQGSSTPDNSGDMRY
jgi:hypothetical protein